MQTLTKRSNTLLFSTLLLIGAGIFSSTNAISHPHNVLARCALPNGTSKMCDQTKHDLKSNKHVAKSSAAKNINKIKTNENPVAKVNKIKAKGSTTVKVNKMKAKGSSSAGAQLPKAAFGIPFSASCASGFTKAGQQAMGNGDMDWYVCSTPVITCPSYIQENGLKADVKVKAIVQLIGGSPDNGGPQKFRVQYKCDYSINSVPVG